MYGCEVTQPPTLTIIQLLQNVREPSPPRTPSRRNESMESSPVAAPPQFDDVAWSDGKRRRVDTVTDIQRPSNVSEYPVYDARSASSVVLDPALSSAYNSPRSSHPASMHPSVSSHHHRPSLPYPPPPSNPAAHTRHQSSPVPQGHAAYHHPHAPAMIQPPGPYPHPPLHHSLPYDPRASYYQDPHQPPHGHPYDRAPHPEAYYPRVAYAGAPHPVYENTYHQQAPPYNYTFQSALGVDNNSFNRKRRGNLPKEATGILKAWFSAHRDSPYPTEDEKVSLCAQTQLTLNQVSFHPNISPSISCLLVQKDIHCLAVVQTTDHISMELAKLTSPGVQLVHQRQEACSAKRATRRSRKV
jgi:hypothetical protein